MAATATIHENSRCKTVLIYRGEEGVSLIRYDARNKSKQEMSLSIEELHAIAQRWPEWQEFLLNAGALNVEPVTHSPNGSRAGRGHGNSLSSPAPGQLL